MKINLTKQRTAFGIILVFMLSLTGLGNAAQFHVTTAQEFQTALSTAAINGEDDIILLDAGIFEGSFSYQSSEINHLTIKPENGLNPG